MKFNEVRQKALLDQARTLAREKKYLHAVQFYLRMIATEPSYVHPYSELASLYAELGQIDAGIALLRKAEAHSPDATEIIFQLARYYLRSEQYHRALTYFKKLDGKKMPEVHYNLGIIYYYKNDIKRAEEQFRKTVKFDPHFPKIDESLGELLLKKGAYTEAVGYLLKGIEKYPSDAVNHHLLGVAYTKLDNWKKAQTEFKRASDFDPNQAAHWERYGECLIHLHQYDDAALFLQKALTLSPHSVGTLIHLGQVSTARGEKERAAQYYQQALDLDPKNIKARTLRAQLCTVDEDEVKQ